jgi:hypothetical protein
MQEPRENLKNRVYYAAKDGMSIALYALLVSGDKQEVEDILNEVSDVFVHAFKGHCHTVLTGMETG